MNQVKKSSLYTITLLLAVMTISALTNYVIKQSGFQQLYTFSWDKVEIPSYGKSGTKFYNSKLWVNTSGSSDAVFTDGTSQLKFQIDHDSRTANGDFNYRAEIFIHPWRVNHPLGTEIWLGWKYYFANDYIIDEYSPITIFQVKNGQRGQSPQLELELAAKDQIPGAKGGEIQIINKPNNQRILTNFIPNSGDSLSIVMHIVYQSDTTGLWTIWFNHKIVYDYHAPTVYQSHPYGGNAKWGLYHHGLRGSNAYYYQGLAIDQGIHRVGMSIGTLRYLRRSPTDKGYLKDAYLQIVP